MTKINSSGCEDLFFAYKLSETSSKGTIILLDGLPSNPSSKDPLIRNLSEKGWDVFFPRYKGTWDSKGKFLEEEPSKAIIEFIEKLKQGVNLGDEDYTAKKIFLLGSSLGGAYLLIFLQNIWLIRSAFYLLL